MGKNRFHGTAAGCPTPGIRVGTRRRSNLPGCPREGVDVTSGLDSTSVTSLRRARILWNSLRHLGRLTDVARAAVSDRACDPRLNDDHGTNTEISPDFRMCSGPGQDEVLHP